MNVKLLRRVKKHILDEPKRFLMRTFIVRRETPDQKKFRSDAGAEIPFAKCGTAACIGGWAVLLSDGAGSQCQNVRNRAIELLELEPREGVPGMHDELFEVSYWPPKFCTAYKEARSQRKRARIAAARIEHFIKTGG